MDRENAKPVLARRLDGVSESATLKLNAAVQAMKAQGVDIVNLTAGEPDFWVPDAAKDAAIEAIRANRSRYTPVAGIPELKQAVADKTNRQHATLSKSKPWKASDVLVTNGGKQAIFNALMALIDPGDEVLIPAPYWLSYPEMVKLTGGGPKFIHAPFSQGFKITPAQLKAALTPRVKAILLNSPNNPTGAMYSRAEYAALADVIQAQSPQTWVISDEIYDRIILGDVPFCSFLEAAPSLRDRCITVNGLAKSAAMTGWRLGWSVSPPPLTQGMSTLQGQSTSGVNSVAQWGAVAALRMSDQDFAPHVESFRNRRSLALDILRKAGKMDLFTPEGAFYAFVGVGRYLKPGEDSISFAERLLADGKVAVVPGTPFGEPKFLRLSFASDEKSIREGCERIVEYLET